MISYKNRENLLQNVVDSLYYFNRIKFIYKDMANESHSLKIGDVEYPIYSEGIKLDTSKNDHSSGKFLVVTGNSGNQTIGASSAITGNNEYLTISGDYIKHGCGADYVDVGNSATELHVGNSATAVGIGNSADEVNIGRMSYGVNVGNQCEGNVVIADGRATNGFTTDSDERLKDFGDDIAVDLDALAVLRKSYYRWNETSGFENEKDRMLGMSAQEVQKIYPELVDADENGMLSMAYDRLSVVALAAIDKLHETNKELKAENDELKDRIANLENLVDTILSRIN